MKSPVCRTTKSGAAAIKVNAEFLRIVGDENRLRILCLLQKGERCVCDIWQYLNLPQNLTSHHLSVLKEQKLILARKVGLKVFYSINRKVMSHHYISLTHLLWRTHQSYVSKFSAPAVPSARSSTS